MKCTVKVQLSWALVADYAVREFDAEDFDPAEVSKRATEMLVEMLDELVTMEIDMEIGKEGKV